MAGPLAGVSTIAATAGVTGTNSAPAPGGAGVSGSSTQADGVNGVGLNGVHGISSAPAGSGMLGENSGGGNGVLGTSVGGLGVSGTSLNSTAVQGVSQSKTNAGVSGTNTSGGVGVIGYGGPGPAGQFEGNVVVHGSLQASADGLGVSCTSINSTAVQGVSQSKVNAGVSGTNTSGGVGVIGYGGPGPAGQFEGDVVVAGQTQAIKATLPSAPKGSLVLSASGGETGIGGYGSVTGVFGRGDAPKGAGIYGQGAIGATNPSSNGGIGVFGYGGAFGVAGLINDPTTSASTISPDYYGMCAVYGEATAPGNSIGVVGWAKGTGGYGVLGRASGNGLAGVVAASHSGGIALIATGNGGQAAEFDGAVVIRGTLTKSAGGFRIDHPLCPDTKYLQHSFVESPEMMNVYSGVVTLKETGESEVQLPDWFEAINRDFRYQLTSIGRFAPVFVSQEVRNNRFRIAGGVPGDKICWQVTGVRCDTYAEQYRLEVELDKKVSR